MKADKPAMMMAGLFNLYDSIQRNSKNQYIVIFNGTTSKSVAQRYFPPSGQLCPLLFLIWQIFT